MPAEGIVRGPGPNGREFLAERGRERLAESAGKSSHAAMTGAKGTVGTAFIPGKSWTTLESVVAPTCWGGRNGYFTYEEWRYPGLFSGTKGRGGGSLLAVEFTGTTSVPAGRVESILAGLAS